MKKTKLQINRTTIQNMSQQQMARIQGGVTPTQVLACKTQECTLDCPTGGDCVSGHPKCNISLDC